MKMAGDVHLSTCLTSVTVLLVLFCCLLPVQTEDKVVSLFSPSDPVTVLHGSSFADTVYDSSNIWAVLFYSSWCGHCQQYAPYWKEIGKVIKRWGHVVKIASLNCAEPGDSAKFCRNYGVNAYPTIRYFHPDSDEQSTTVKHEGNTDVLTMMRAFITQAEANSAKEKPEGWPTFHALESLEDIWNEVTPNIKYTVVIFEEPGGWDGREVIMEMSSVKTVLVRRMLKEHISEYGITKFPSMYLVGRDGIFQSLVEKGDRVSFLLKLYDLTGIHIDSLVRVDPTPVTKKAPVVSTTPVPTKLLKKAVVIHMQDLESVLHYSLRQEVSGTKKIEGPNLLALKDYVSMLAKYFPGSEVVKKFLRNLNAWLSNIKVISGESWLKQIGKLETSSAHLPNVIKWVGCKGSSPKYRGYPCGLWTLFHTLFINSVLDDGDVETFKPTSVALAMRGYIHHFFGCRECSQHFMARSVNLHTEIKSSKALVLWLWSLHNSVNRDLRGDITEDPMHPKIQFPSIIACPQCHKEDLTGDPNLVKWNEAEIYSFLTNIYGRDNIMQDAEPFKFIPKLHDDDGKTSTSKPFLLQPHKKEEEPKLEHEPNVAQPSRTSTPPANRGIEPGQDTREKFKGFAQKLAQHQAEMKRQNDVTPRVVKSEDSHRIDIKKAVATIPSYMGLNRLDVSMCIGLYVTGTLILVVVYYRFSVKRRSSLKARLKEKSAV